MVRERTPARKAAQAQVKHQLGDSWVVETNSDGDDEYTPSPPPRRTKDASEQAQQARKRPKPASKASAEPEFIMPSISTNGVGGSWMVQEKWRDNNEYDQRINVPRKEVRQKPQQQASSPQDFAVQTSVRFWQLSKPIMAWIFEILGQVFHLLKLPISLFLAVWMLVGAFMLLRNMFVMSLYSALSPVCRIPGVQYFGLPMCQNAVMAGYDGQGVPSVEFDKLMVVQDQFEAILQESAGGVSLPLDMKRGETSIRDLRQIVRFSHLHSRNELVLEFDGFIETARMASYDLQKFNSHVGRGVDHILATARWTKRILDGIAERDASQGAVASFFNNRLMAPFQPLKFTEATLLEEYVQYTRVMEEEINRLVAEAQAVLLTLQNLEDRLDVIHGIALRDNLHVQGSKAEVLSQLWTMLGGNRGRLGKFESQLKLLGQVNTYRQTAIAHVSGTMVKLQGMGAELEELRERVGGVELLGRRGQVPLSVHIENIEMGVERLEQGRRGAKELENEQLRKSLDRGARVGIGAAAGERAIEG